MEPRSLSFISRACNGELRLRSNDFEVSEVCTDSRALKAGDLFWALRGERFDGHEFIPKAAQQGALAIAGEKQHVGESVPGCATICVDDTRTALGALAKAYRSDFTPLMIAVGGSNGKTTTKELIAAVLRQKQPTLASEASYNNDIGVPLTLLKLTGTHRAAVLEVGTNHPGELKPLLEMIQPSVGVITSIGSEHLEFFRDISGVAQEEGSIAQCLPPGGLLLHNGDHAFVAEIRRRSRARVMSIGTSVGCSILVSNIKFDLQGTAFDVTGFGDSFDGEYRVKLLGRHQAVNATFAIATGRHAGLTPEQVRSGLASCEGPKMRLQLVMARGATIIDDSYNANADSMKAALSTLAELPVTGRRIAVLGDMAELGETAEQAHREVGAAVASHKIDILVTVGKLAGLIADAAGQRIVIHRCDDANTAAQRVTELVQPGDAILLKASRTARLERVREALQTAENL